MDRTSRGAALAGILGVVALAAAAAGIPVATSTGGGGPGGPAPGRESPPPAPTAPELGGVPSLLVAAVVLVGLCVLVWTLLRGDPPARLAVVLVALTLFVGLAALLDLLFRGGATPGGFDSGLPVAAGDDGTGGDASGGGLAVPPTLLAVAAVVAVALPALLFVLAREGPDPDRDPEDGDADARTAIARAAGRAADRIEGGERALDNEVYRCWREMTTPLEPANPAATTPAEFERTAVDRGVDPDHARELTALFERVRYGGYSPGEDEERRAVELLRRIEAAYGDAGSTGGEGT